MSCPWCGKPDVMSRQPSDSKHIMSLSSPSPTARRRSPRTRLALLLLAGMATSIYAGGASAEGVQAYKIGPGDRLTITVAGQETFSGKFPVGPDGSISYPLLGDLAVASLTPGAVADRIGQGLSQYLQAGNAVRVSIEEYAPVFVVGDVDRPGQFQFRPGMIALELVAVGGGLRRAQLSTESGTLQLIQTEQDFADLKLQQFALQVRQARILAEMAGNEFSYALPDHDGVLNRQAMQQVVDVENTLFRTRRDVLSNQEKALTAQRASYDPEIAALEQSIKLYDEEMGLIAQDVAAMKTLADQKLTAQSRLREVQRGYSAAQRDELEQRSFLARARQNQLDIDQRIVELHSSRANENASDLRDLNLEMSRDEQKSASLLATLSELKRQADSSASAVMTMTTSYTITRLVDGRHEQVAADEQTTIEPGDILRIEQKLTAGGVRLSLN